MVAAAASGHTFCTACRSSLRSYICSCRGKSPTRSCSPLSATQHNCCAPNCIGPHKPSKGLELASLLAPQPTRPSRGSWSPFAGLWIFPKGWGSEHFILKCRPEFRPPTTHQILVLTHSRACACKLTHPPTHQLHVQLYSIYI